MQAGRWTSRLIAGDVHSILGDQASSSQRRRTMMSPFWHLLHQKGHWYLEIFISGVETLLFDILIGLIGWRYVLKPYIAQRQAQAIAQDHAFHGIEAHTNDVDESGEQPVAERRDA